MPSDENVSPRCEAATCKAAGRHSQRLLRAIAKFAKEGNEDRVLRGRRSVKTSLTPEWLKRRRALGKSKCTPNVSEIAYRTANYAGSVAAEARGLRPASVLFVQTGTGGTLSEDTLTLTRVPSRTGWCSEHP